MNEQVSTAPEQDSTGTSPRKRGRPSSLVIEVRICPQCQGAFETKINPATGDVAKGFKTTYCSRACSRQVANARTGAESRAEYEADPRRCPCGEALPYEVRNHAKSYCSSECRATYGRKRKRNEANYVTFPCQTCGKEVERYKKYGNGALMFCSNACAAKHTSRRQRILIDEEFDMVLDSSYEAFVWSALRIAKVQVERFDRQSAVEWAPGHWYAPDLWLPTLSLAVECKGLTDPEDEARWIAYRASRGLLAVVDRSVLLPVSPTSIALALQRLAA